MSQEQVEIVRRLWAGLEEDPPNLWLEYFDEEVELTVVSVQRTQGRMRHTELPANLQWAAIWKFRDGKVLRAEGYMQRAEALEAAGVGQ